MRSALHKKFLPPSGRGVAPDSLLADLLAYWPLDEQSGFRYNATDPTAFSAKFVSGNSESLSHVDNVDLSITGDKSFAAWVKLDDLAANYGIIEKRTAADEYQCLARAGTGKLNVYIADSVAGYSEILNTTDGLVAGRWHLIIWWYDSADKKVRAQIDLGAIDAGAALANGPKDSNSLFELGALASAGFFLNGMMSRVGIWNRVLSAPERTELYNSGRGKLFSQLSAGIQVGLVSYWNLGELSGNRADSFGANTLTDNNTVGADFDYPGILKLTDNNTVTYINDGPRGVSAKLVTAASESLDVASPVGQVTGDKAWAFWVKIPNSASAYGLFSKEITGATREYNAYTGAGTGVPGMLIFEGANFVTATGTINVCDNQWHLVVFEYDFSDRKLYISEDGGTQTVSAALGADPNIDNSRFTIGVGKFTTFLEGQVANFGMWDRLLTALERAALYRQGIGKRYSDLGPPEKVNLVSYWNLDEVSIGAAAVTRNDSHGTNHLTDNNTVNSYHTGPEQVVGNFAAAATEYLSAAITGTQFSFSCWAYIPGYSTNMTIFSTDLSATRLSVRNIGYLEFVYNGTPAAGISIPNAGWHHLVVGFDGTNFKHYVDGILVSTDASASGTFNNIRIGEATDTSWPYNSKIANCGLWSSMISGATVLSLFNAGVAKKYSGLTAAEKVNLVSYWNLTELSGNRADSHGANTLTDNNTVMSVINMPDVANNIAAKFDGVSNESLSNDAFTLPGAVFTCSLWANLDSIAGNDGLIFFVQSPATERWRISQQLGTLYSLFNNAAPFVSKTPVALEWMHVLVWSDGVNLYMSLNDDTPSTVVAALTAGTNIIKIGGYSFFTAGKIDEVAIWSRVLLPAERTRLFNLGKGIFYPTFTP